MSCFYPRSRVFTIKLYILIRLIPVTLIILAIGILSFIIISALIRVLIKCSLRIKVLILEVNILIILLLKRIERVKGASSFKSKLKSKGILYYSSSSSFSFLLELLIKESSDFNSSLNNLKSKKSNKISFIMRINE
jgi:Mn2+/Fe2+ NRAMP family transporter